MPKTWVKKVGGVWPIYLGPLREVTRMYRKEFKEIFKERPLPDPHDPEDSMSNLIKTPACDRYLGVWYHTTDKKYKAFIQVNERRRLYLGRRNSPVETAMLYDEKAKELFGAAARLNFPRGYESCPSTTSPDQEPSSNSAMAMS